MSRISTLNRQNSLQDLDLQTSNKTTGAKGSQNTSDVGRVDGPLAHRTLSVGHRDENVGATVQRDAGRSRLTEGLAKFGKGLGKVLGYALAAPFLAIPLAVAKIRDVVQSGALRNTREAAQARMAHLGQPLPGGVMDRTIQASGNRQLNMPDVMRAYLSEIRGGNVTNAEVAETMQFINMGERIVKSLNSDQAFASFEQNGHLTLEGPDGIARQVKPSLESARAISWFLQAKAVVDNAGPNRDPITLGRGSMVMQDPGNRMFKFLNAAPNAYGRVSTHYAERSQAPKANPLNSGFDGIGGMIGKQPAQRGIEDFEGKMPSERNALLFDKLQGKDGSEQLMLKWEVSGMPTLFGVKGTHADDSSGWTGKVMNRFLSITRCFRHTFSFFERMGGAHTGGGADRREGTTVAATGTRVFQPFEAVIRQAVTDGVISQDRADIALRDGRRKGVDEMTEQLDAITNAYNGNVPDAITTLQTDITAFKTEMGANLGIERKGAEIHVSRDTSYLD